MLQQEWNNGLQTAKVSRLNDITLFSLQEDSEGIELDNWRGNIQPSEADNFQSRVWCHKDLPFQLVKKVPAITSGASEVMSVTVHIVEEQQGYTVQFWLW